MKHYYIKHPRDFYNEYSLYSVEADSPSETLLKLSGYNRITRKEAERKCREERDRAENDPAFSGYAPDTIEEYIMPRRYILRDMDGYGSDAPICVSKREARQLMRSWYAMTDAPEFDDVWREADENDIAKYGISEDE